APPRCGDALVRSERSSSCGICRWLPRRDWRRGHGVAHPPRHGLPRGAWDSHSARRSRCSHGGRACPKRMTTQPPDSRTEWSGMVMAILRIVFALAVGFAFMPHMENVLSTPYAASGMTDTRAFVTPHLISSAASHLFIAPAIAVFVGAVSAAAFQLLASLGRR